MENARRTVLPDAARIGTVELGSFRLKEVLGRGSYGTAFLAHQEGIEREAVVKIAHASLLQGRDADHVRARFAAELRAATQVDHPNVITLFTAGDTSDGAPAIAMEYVRGASLEDFLEQRAGQLPSALLHGVFAQLGSAIAAFHRASVIHRDLSPANIILGEAHDGSLVPKVLDFGAARLGVGNGRSSIVGTPRYMAPEQVVGTSGPASDVYALGAMLWWALSGEEVQSDVMTLQDVMEARLMGPRRRDIREVVPEVSPDVASLLAEMLDFEPSARPSAETFCERWAECGRTQSSVATPRRATIAPRVEPGKTQRLEQREAVCLGGDPLRIAHLRSFLEPAKFRLHVVPLGGPMRSVPSPDVVFVAAGPTEGAALEQARAAFPGVTLVAMVQSERERTTMIRAGADVAVRVPNDLQHLAEVLEEARAPREVEASPALSPRPVSALDIESFVGLAPELIADIVEAIEDRRIGEVLGACAVLREQARALGGVELAQLSAACAAFVETEDFSGAAGFGAELEREYGNFFQRLMASHSEQTQQQSRW